MNVVQLCQTIELIVSDVDGVLTDGSLYYDNDGLETKRFHIRDGLGIKLWRRGGGKFALATGRTSQMVQQRALELGIDIVRQGTEHKLQALKEIMEELSLRPEQVCYIGDDLPDLPAVRAAGLGVSVADGCADVRAAANFITTLPGGAGAVRETIELILHSQQRWDELIREYD